LDSQSRQFRASISPQNFRHRSSHAGQPVSSFGDILEKRPIHEVLELELSLIGYSIKTRQQSVNLPRVAHDQWSFAGTQKIAAKLVPICDFMSKIADPPEAVVGSAPDEAALEAPRKGCNAEGARDGNPAAQDPFGRIPALPHIRAGKPGGDKSQDNVTDAGQEMHAIEVLGALW
jgi:hypothetical protein